ncbi:unnamed protein product [Owenia fusiformis]|uniref:Uncharacterized protein n=1 Tax=Owenia fusiformis TaxID=6347 RepID=A0A8J1U4X0_OWEFU|nr:unnamed protein product [Owenia fusiformis]
MAEELKHGPNYKEHFDTQFYLRSNYSDPRTSGLSNLTYLLDKLHTMFSSGQIKGAKLLEFGTGPTIHTLISASKYVTDITCAEYAECNRNEINKWLQWDKDAHDWTETFQYIAGLEGSRDIKSMELRVRGALKQVIPCDINLKNPLHPFTYSNYDTTISSLVLESACHTLDHYGKSLKRIGSLIKDGGKLIMYGLLKESSYMVNGVTFHSLYLEADDVIRALKNAGFIRIDMKICETDLEPSISKIDESEKFLVVCDKRENACRAK